MGIPYLYDRKESFYFHDNKYIFLENGVEYIVRAHRKKLKISLVNAGYMKRLVNASKTFFIFMSKKKNDIDYEPFEGCDDKLKYDLFDVIRRNDKMFQEPKVVPPKRGIQHEIQLQQDVPLPNISMYHMSIMESLEIKSKIQEFLRKGIVHPSTSPCGSPIVLVPKKDGT